VPYLGEFHPGSKFNDTYKTEAQGVAVQPDGEVVLVGYVEVRGFNNLRSYAPVLARYATDGTLDPSFGEAGVVAPRTGGELALDKVLHAAAIAPGGRIIGAGAESESQYGTHRKPLVIAYTPEGKVDRGFGRNGSVVFRVPLHNLGYSNAFTAVKVLPSGKILLAGYLHGWLSLARLLPSGRHDRSFGGGDGKVSLRIEEPTSCCGEWVSLAVEPDGRIVLAGEVQGGGEGFHVALARFRPNGRLDRSFGNAGLQLLDPAPQNAAFAALTQPSGRVVAGGVLARDKGDHNETELLLTRYLSGSGR
jgi:uncharacterized delta-60 repeat protein